MPFNNSGLRALGVNAVNPPDTIFMTWEPTENDYIMHDVGKLWYVDYGTTPQTFSLWYLASKANMSATWVKLYPQAGGGGAGGNLRSDDTLIEYPDATVDTAINVSGGQPYAAGTDTLLNNPLYANIFTAQNPDINSLQIVLKRSIRQPVGTADGANGLYSIGGDDFMHAYGTSNTMLGIDAGNRGFVIGAATNNTCIGYNTLQGIQTANHCTGLGHNVLPTLVGGAYTIALGKDAGVNYIANESSDILLGNPGILGGGESNVIRIGVMGNGDGQQNQAFLAGVWNSPATPVINTAMVIVDDAGQLYKDTIAPYSVICKDAGSNPVGKIGLNGQVLIGATGGSPEWANITAGAGIGIAVGANSITISAGGVGALLQLGADDGHTALPVAAQINVIGANLIETSVTPDGGQDLAVGLTQGLDAQIIGGNTGLDPSWKTLACSDGSLDIIHGPAGIDITVIGVPPVGGVNYLMDHALQHVTPTLNGILLEQGANITTVGDIPTSKITISVTDDVTLAGFLHAADEIQTTGIGSSLITDLGHVKLPNTNAADIGGTIRFNDVRWISNYGTSNTFVGANSGSLALDTVSAKDCTFIGRDVGRSHVTGESNTALGSAAFDVNASGAQCTVVGVSAFGNDLGSSYTTCLGWHAGYAAVGVGNDSCLYIDNVGVNGESNCIRIGTNGVAAHNHDKCYIAGIYSGTAGAAPRMVVCGSDHKLSTQAIPAGSAHSYVTNDGTATVSGSSISVLGTDNINTSGAGSVVTVHLNTSIMQPDSNPAGVNSDGFYCLGGGATDYLTYRFMHNTGTSCTWLGLQAGGVGAVPRSVGCVGIGASALTAIGAGASSDVAIGRNSMKNATSASNCICLGTSSGLNLTSSVANILIGSSGGLNYDAESYNIILGGSAGSSAGDAGQVNDSRKMYLGYKQVINATTGAITTHGTDDTYVYGIYGRTVASSAQAVFVDHLGKLGTSGSVAFSVHLNTNLSNVTGDATIYKLGQTTSTLSVDFDTTSSITIGGGGNPMYVTIPQSGKYFFSATVTYSIPAAAAPAALRVSPLYLIVIPLDPSDPDKSHSFSTYIPNPIVGVAQYASEVVTAFLDLKVGDKVQWWCKVSNGAKTIGLQAIDTGAGIPCWATYFSGNKISI